MGATKIEGNPIMQDEKKGKARLYHGPIFWNYGCLPQTWEDPNVKGDADVDGAFGDNDPVDVVEIGSSSLAMGSFTPVKAVGVLSMIPDGEPVNGFGHGEKALGAKEAKEVIEETHGFYN